MLKRQLLAKSSCAALLLTILSLAAPASGTAQDKGDIETIDATAMGTSTQMGRVGNVKIQIERYSSPEERQTLVDAFLKGKNDGLVKALSKMRPAGRISLPGTVGYQLAFVREIPTSTGRRIRFVTDRKIAFGKAYHSTRSKDYSLTAGEFELNDKDPNKSTGVLYPAARFIINSDRELEIELYQNPWKLNNVLEWSKKDKR